MGVELIGDEIIAVIAGDAVVRTHPDIAFVVNDHAVDPVRRQALLHTEMLEGQAHGGWLGPEQGASQEDRGEKASIKQKAAHAAPKLEIFTGIASGIEYSAGFGWDLTYKNLSFAYIGGISSRLQAIFTSTIRPCF